MTRSALTAGFALVLLAACQEEPVAPVHNTYAAVAPAPQMLVGVIGRTFVPQFMYTIKTDYGVFRLTGEYTQFENLVGERVEASGHFAREGSFQVESVRLVQPPPADLKIPR